MLFSAKILLKIGHFKQENGFLIACDVCSEVNHGALTGSVLSRIIAEISRNSTC